MDASEADSSPVPLSAKFVGRGAVDTGSEGNRLQASRGLHIIGSIDSKDCSDSVSNLCTVAPAIGSHPSLFESPTARERLVKTPEMSPSRRRAIAPSVLAAVQRQMEDLEDRLGCDIEEMQERSLKLQRSAHARQADVETRHVNVESLDVASYETNDCRLVDGAWSFRAEFDHASSDSEVVNSQRNAVQLTAEVPCLLAVVEQRIATVIEEVGVMTSQFRSLRTCLEAQETKLVDVSDLLKTQATQIADLQESVAEKSREDHIKESFEDARRLSLFTLSACSTSEMGNELQAESQSPLQLRLDRCEERLELLDGSLSASLRNTEAITSALSRQMQDVITRICHIERHSFRGEAKSSRFRGQGAHGSATEPSASEVQVGCWRQQACRSRWSAMKLRGRKLRC